METLTYEQMMSYLVTTARTLPAVVARGMRRGAVLVEARLRENLSGPILKRRTSTLVRSVGHVEEDEGLVQRIGATTFYIAIHEGEPLERATVEGGHVVIVPKAAKVLRFQVAPGRWVSRKRVRIPIRRPVGTTYEQTKDAAAREAYETVVGALGGGTP